MKNTRPEVVKQDQNAEAIKVLKQYKASKSNVLLRNTNYLSKLEELENYLKHPLLIRNPQSVQEHNNALRLRFNSDEAKNLKIVLNGMIAHYLNMKPSKLSKKLKKTNR